MTILSSDEIAQRVDALREPPAPARNQEWVSGDVDAGVGAGRGSRTPPPASNYRFVRPLDDAATALIDTFRNTEGRFLLGIEPLDLRMRGIGRGELMYLTGFAHGGKTQLALQAILNQRHQAVIWFSPDETATQVLAKLVSMLTGWHGRDIEERVAEGDRDTVDAVKRVAHSDLANLLVVDEVLSLGDMDLAVQEAEGYFGREVALVGVDYLGLLAEGSEYGDISSRSKAVKRWTKSLDRPVICIHQGSRGGAGRGKELSLQSMAYSGEAEATFVVGCRRKLFDDSLDAFERTRHETSITVALLKNKRVSGGLGGEIDLYLDPTSGQVREQRSADIEPEPAPDWRQLAIGDEF